MGETAIETMVVVVMMMMMMIERTCRGRGVGDGLELGATLCSEDGLEDDLWARIAAVQNLRHCLALNDMYVVLWRKREGGGWGNLGRIS